MLTLAYLQRRSPSRNVHSSQPTSSRTAFLPHEGLAWRQQEDGWLYAGVALACFVSPRVVERDGGDIQTR